MCQAYGVSGGQDRRVSAQRALMLWGGGVGGDGGKTGKFPTAQKSLHFILGTAGGHQGHSG